MLRNLALTVFAGVLILVGVSLLSQIGVLPPQVAAEITSTAKAGCPAGSDEPGLVPWRGRTSLGPWGVQRCRHVGGPVYANPRYWVPRHVASHPRFAPEWVAVPAPRPTYHRRVWHGERHWVHVRRVYVRRGYVHRRREVRIPTRPRVPPVVFKSVRLGDPGTGVQTVIHPFIGIPRSQQGACDLDADGMLVPTPGGRFNCAHIQ